MVISLRLVDGASAHESAPQKGPLTGWIFQINSGKFLVFREQRQLLQRFRAGKGRRNAQYIIIFFAQPKALAHAHFRTNGKGFHPHLQGLAGYGVVRRAEFDAHMPAGAKHQGPAHAQQSRQFGIAAGGVFRLAVSNLIFNLFSKGHRVCLL